MSDEVRRALCRFFVPHNPPASRWDLHQYDEGECRHNSPGIIVSEDVFKKPMAAFPIITAHKFCGAFIHVE